MCFGRSSTLVRSNSHRAIFGAHKISWKIVFCWDENKKWENICSFLFASIRLVPYDWSWISCSRHRNTSRSKTRKRRIRRREVTERNMCVCCEKNEEIVDWNIASKRNETSNNFCAAAEAKQPNIKTIRPYSVDDKTNIMNSTLLATLHKAIKFPKWKKEKIKSFLNGLTVNVVLYACSLRSVSGLCHRIHTTRTPRRRWFLLLFKIAGSIQLIDGCVVLRRLFSIQQKNSIIIIVIFIVSDVDSLPLFTASLCVPVLINSERSSTIRRTKRRTQAMAFWCESTNIASRSLPIAHAFPLTRTHFVFLSPDRIAIEFQLLFLFFFSQWQRIFKSFASHCSLHSIDILNRYGPRWRVSARIEYSTCVRCGLITN